MMGNEIARLDNSYCQESFILISISYCFSCSAPISNLSSPLSSRKGKKYVCTLSSVTPCRLDGLQAGVWSLSMITENKTLPQ